MFLLWILFMIYELSGSLSHSSTTWTDFFSAEPYLGRTRDWIENFLLSLPGAILAGLAFSSQKKTFYWVIAWFLPLFLTGTVMEVFQRWMPDRHASFWDSVFMVIGIGAGIIIGWSTKSFFRERFELSKANLIFFLWMAYPCIPAELQLNEAVFYQALNLLKTTDNISIGGIIWGTGCWLIVSHLAPSQSTRTLPILIVLFTLLGIMAPERVVLPELVIGGGFAAIILAINRAYHFPQIILTFIFALIAIMLELTESVPMHSQLPLLRFPLLFDLSGSRWLVIFSAVLEDYFLFLSLPWAIISLTTDFKSAFRWTIAGGIAILIATLVPPLFFSTPFTRAGFIIYLVNAYIANALNLTSPSSKFIFLPRTIFLTKPSLPTSHPLFPVFCGVAVISIAVAAIINLPGVPYNVRDLFDTRNLFLGSTIFSVFLTWNVAVPCVMAYSLIKYPILHLFQPVLYLVMATFSWFLLRYAVSAESLHDILGSPIWGMPSDLELYFRFLAFAYPFLWSLFCWNLFFQLLTHRKVFVSLLIWLISIFIGMPLFLAAKYLIFDLAATDNVVELIKNIPALFSLIFLIAWNGVFVAHRSSVFFGVMVTGLSAMMSYPLLSTALYSNAISFILSPDRATLMTGTILRLRWTLFYVLTVGFIVFGQILIKPWVEQYKKSPPKMRKNTVILR